MALDLDDRQRAMLEEMRVHVWWPRQQPSSGQVADAVALPVSAALPPEPFAAATTVLAPAALQPAQGPSLNAASGIDAMDWTAMARHIAGCQACALCVGRKNPVFHVQADNWQADWLVVGEPPDEHEERGAVPFAGPAGELLDNMLRAVGLTRGGVGAAGARLTTIVKCRPAAVRNPTAEELAACSVYLRREIDLVQPRVILAMGRFAAQLLAGGSDPALARLPFGKLRGQLFQYGGVPVVVTHHPARLLRAPEDKAGAWADLVLAQRVARQPR